MKYSVLIAIGVVFLASCRKEEPQPDEHEPPMMDTSQLEVVWRTSIYEGLKSAGSFRPILFEDLVIASADQVGRGDIEKVFALDRMTGDTVWVWDDYLSPQNGEEISRNIVESEGDVLFFSSTHGLYAVNKRDGRTLWREFVHRDFGEAGVRLVNKRFDVLNGKAYFDVRWGTIPDIDSAYFMEYDMRSGQNREVLRFHKRGLHGPALAKPAAFVNENGDEMVLIQCHYLRTERPVNAYPAMYCYNLTHDSLAWQIDSLESYDAGSPIGPAIHEDQAIVFGTWTIFSLDLNTGEENWRWYFPESGGFSFADWDIHNGVMYFKTNRGDLTALDIELGTPIYVNDNSNLGGYCRGVQYYDGRLLWASKWLFMADAQTGELIERFTAPSELEDNKSGYYTTGMVDRENQLYYVCDGHDLICYKIRD
jgi:outer membrane protein assembly factor BamB